MTAYKRTQPPESFSEVQEAKVASDAAKAKRQEVLARVRKQRAQAYKNYR